LILIHMMLIASLIEPRAHHGIYESKIAAWPKSPNEWLSEWDQEKSPAIANDSHIHLLCLCWKLHNSTLPCEKYNETKYIIHYLASKFTKNTHQSKKNKRCVSHCGLAIYMKKVILRQKKNYVNSNISPCKKYINFQNNPLKETKILKRYYITL
jgi:hypothetical protein